MTTIYVLEKHHQLLEIWRSQNATNLCVAHLDFHCDMHGLLIDRAAQRAYDIGGARAGLGQGTFLTHAIFEGRIQRVRWVHDVPGGRRDDLVTVRYETDLSVRLTRGHLMRQSPGSVPLAYEVLTYSEWSGLEAGEFLDICWDVFACNYYAANTIESRIESRVNTFFERDFTCVPEQISICYSPEYSHPTRPQFESFIQRLAERFQAKIERFSDYPPEPVYTSRYKKVLPRPLYKVLCTVKDQSNLWLRRHDIY